MDQEIVPFDAKSHSQRLLESLSNAIEHKRAIDQYSDEISSYIKDSEANFAAGGFSEEITHKPFWHEKNEHPARKELTLSWAKDPSSGRFRIMFTDFTGDTSEFGQPIAVVAQNKPLIEYDRRTRAYMAPYIVGLAKYVEASFEFTAWDYQNSVEQLNGGTV